jgi:putative ABC transport system substrate-binding protein
MTNHIRRREFITLLGGAAAAWPFGARAQQPPVPTIGYLYGGSPNGYYEAAFRKGLSEMGFVEGRNVAIDTTSISKRLGNVGE